MGEKSGPLHELDRILPNLPASKKASKNSVRNGTLCCKLPSLLARAYLSKITNLENLEVYE